MKLSNKTYDILKYIVTIFLPALTTFWLALAVILEIPHGEVVGAIMQAFTVFLGTLIGISNANYRKGQNDTDKRN